MKIPRQLFVNGKKWKVKLVDECIVDEIHADGSCCHETRTIEIVKSNSFKKQKHTLLHELFHAWCFENFMFNILDDTAEHFIADNYNDCLSENGLVK